MKRTKETTMIFSRNLTSMLTGCGIVAAVGVMPAMVAANDTVTDQAPLILAQADEFDDATIEAFAAAQVRLGELQALYTARMEAAETDEQRTQISEEATQEMVAAVEATPNITVEEYGAVIQAANEDPALVERINEAIAQTQS
jgi:Spy/CpxP family protein refolding chaperone